MADTIDKRSTFGSPTVKFVSALLAWLLVLAFFQLIPTVLRWPVRFFWYGLTLWLAVATFRALRNTTFTMKKTLFMLVLGVFYYLGLTFACHVFLKIISQVDDRISSRSLTALPKQCIEGINALIADNRFNMFSKECGWLPRPGYTHSGPDYTVNQQGIRSTREYPLPAPDADRRILCMGDSFTFGVAVNDEECYPAHAEKLRPSTEWINLGIPGSCLTQSYQRYLRDAATFGGKYVVVAFMTDDAPRTVNAFRPLLNADSGCPYTKPFAKYANGRFSIEPNPYSSLDDFKNLLASEATELPRLIKLDYLTWNSEGHGTSSPIARTFFYVWEAHRLNRNFQSLLNNNYTVNSWIERLMPFDPYGRIIWSKDSAGFKAITSLFEQYRDKIVADGRVPLFVILPGQPDVDDQVRGFKCQYASLVEHFTAHGVPFIDFLPTLMANHKANLSPEALFVNYHYQGHVNKELAAEIIKALKLPKRL